MLGGNYQHDNTHDNQLITSDGTNTGLFKGAPFEYRYEAAASIIRAISGSPRSSLRKLDTNCRMRSPRGFVRYTKDKRIFDGCCRDQAMGSSPPDSVAARCVHGSSPIRSWQPSYIPPGAARP